MYIRPRTLTTKEPGNSNHASDVNYTLEMSRRLLKAVGLWTLIYHRHSMADKAFCIVILTACISILGFTILPSLHSVMFTKNTTEYIVKVLGPISMTLFCTVQYMYLIVKAKPLGRCVQHLEKDWEMVTCPNHRSIMLKYSSISRKLIVVSVVFLYSGGISYHTVKQLITKDTSSINITGRSFVYPPIKFINPQASPNYEIIFFVHCLSGMMQYTITLAVYSLAAIFVTHICGQIQIQISRLNELIEGNHEKRVFYNRIGTIVREHAEVLRFSKDVEEALRELNLVEIAESAVIMCILEFYCMMEWRRNDMIALLTYFTLLISFTFNIMIFCYVGELLTEQCSQIGSASYDIEWYNLPPRRAYNLILVNAVSLEPPKLTAGNVIDLSINTFGSVVRTSLIYLNLLRTVTV
ncbi:odorant receptor 4-like isoform X2 [Megalopta genalis]|uniref:odorant receptor 4-like isoform X2 n=1 Tax=Megalopta genalis TaxID=115081 RepID=UPI003FD30A6A